MEMNLKDNWHKLSPAIPQWHIDNPGCLILPRTLVATICAETGGSADCDRHGEAALSQEDCDSIQAPATGPECRFLDAGQP